MKIIKFLAWFGIIASVTLFCLILLGCQTATATKTSKDGTQDSIKVQSFLGKISQGSYSNGTGMSLSVQSATPDQESLAIAVGGLTDLAKLVVFAAKGPTNTIPAATNPPPTDSLPTK